MAQEEEPEEEIQCGRQPAPTESISGLRILHADDQAMVRGLCQKILTRTGCTVVSVADGDEAWQLLEREPFDLLLTDYNMPRCNGAELIRRIRGAGMRLPIIFTTSDINFWHVDADTVFLLAKPFTGTQLIGAVSKAVAQKKPR